MATGFSTRSGPDGYRLNFGTDNLDYYLLMQKIARHCVDGKPTADVVEVRHGRWMDAESDDGCTVWHCSACSCPVKTIGGYPIYRHCPMCGARMDKEDES